MYEESKKIFFEMSENMKILDTGTNTTKYLISFSYRIGTVQYSTVQYSTVQYRKYTNRL